MNLKAFLDEKVAQYNQPNFIEHDPIQIPHLFSQKQDIEIAGLFAAVLAWGQRVTIIKKCKELLSLMDYTPFDFIRNHQANDLKPFLKFKHRTFNDIDTLYFIHFLKNFYAEHDSLESAFLYKEKVMSMKEALIHFHRLFFSLEDSPLRTRKHISTPERKSACKRLNMYLRWMVRKDNKGVDFGLWEKIAPQYLICPLDVHVERVARKLHLLTRPQTDWEAAIELTENLKKLDPQDPVKYDFALFGLGLEKF
ncbi:TIGR02757 family protein [Thermoflexibacter ruber]|uniref:TIGR02757 family protein n=1 Tax=Thermoflexibacter ruber TaxID=1003 RepID=A0A1I2AAT1_9BACT|nr:TIGR02757 family protein [Thermoflexibacter ruber]SFE41145.1 TIGR02757 family protein [Thermoflexibacter ruber]